MKKAFIILLISFASCEDEPDELSDKIGCLTGVPVGKTDRVPMRCCSRQEFLAGDNTGAGGTSYWNSYTKHAWKAVKDCSECQ